MLKALLLKALMLKALLLKALMLTSEAAGYTKRSRTMGDVTIGTIRTAVG